MPNWKGIVGKSFAPKDFPAYVESVVFGAWRPQFVALHNTGEPTLADWHKAPGQIRMANLENYYKNVQQWSAGPHLFVADDLIWAFTPLNVPGVHSPSWNNVAWGVEMVGDYATETFSPLVRENTLSALAAMHGTLGLDPERLRMHKEDPRTTHVCPGANVLKSDIVHGVQVKLTEMVPGEHVPGMPKVFEMRAERKKDRKKSA